MNEQLDFILSQLSIEERGLNRLDIISRAFAEAGYGSPVPHLQHLVAEGYIEREPNAEVYKLSKKGSTLHMEGGFSRKEAVAREVRIALALSVASVLLLFLIAIIIRQYGGYSPDGH